MPAGITIHKWEGRGGKVWLPRLGAVVATLDTWTLKRREDTPPEEQRWDLHGVFSYVNPVLLKQDGLDWVFEINVSKATYRVHFERSALEFSEPFNFRINGATISHV